MARPRIPLSIKRTVLKRQNGKCACGCGAKVALTGAKTEFDHNPALSLRRRVGRHYIPGANDPRYIQALHEDCHLDKTFHPRGPHIALGGDNYEAKKTARLRRHRLKGSALSEHPVPGSRSTPFKVLMDGNRTIVRREHL